MIDYVVHPPRAVGALVAFLREKGFEAVNSGPHVSAGFPAAADPTEERLILGAAVSAWRREWPGARVDLDGS